MGNSKYIQKVMLALITGNILLYAIVQFLAFSSNEVLLILQLIVRMIIVIVPWIGILWIYNKIPTFHDEIGIADEIKNVMRAYWVMAIFFIIALIIVSLVNDDSDSLLVATHLTYHCLTFISFFTSMLMTYWPIKKYVIKTEAEVTKKKKTVVTIEDICMSMYGMDLLMGHLGAEYARENLLFVCEATLFQRSILQYLHQNKRQHTDLKQDDINNMMQKLFPLPSTFPKSSIVEAEYTSIVEEYGNELNKGGFIMSFRQREMLRFKCIVYELFVKYIKTSSELSVNIASLPRQTLYQLMYKQNKWMQNRHYDDVLSLFEIYEDAKEQVIQLMKNDSLNRFRLKPEFQKIVGMTEEVRKHQMENALLDNEENTEQQDEEEEESMNSK